MFYNPSNWYWIVAASATQVYSSARAAYVPITDATYVAWLEDGNQPTQIDSATDLAPVITAQVINTAYLAALAGGLAVTSTSTPAINGVYAIDVDSQSDITTEAQFVSTFDEFTNGATTNLPWQQANGTMVVFPTTAIFLTFAKAAAQFVATAKLAAATAAAMPAGSVTIP